VPRHGRGVGFLRTGAPYARTAWAHVDGALAHHARDGAAAQREACEATRVRGERSEDLLDRRTMCLEAALWDARALVDRFAVADTRTVEHAAPAVHELGGISACADLQALASQARPPADPAVRARVTALRRQLAEATALAATGRTAEARARASALAIEASATGHRPLEAEVLFRRGLLDDEAGDPASAVSALDRAIWAAEASRHDTLAARAWIALMLVRGDRLGHHASALALEPRVTALLERLGGNVALEAELALARARLLLRAARPDGAERAADHARRLLEQRPAPDDTPADLRVAAAHDLRAAALLAAGRPTEAATALDRALAITRAAHGPEHPAVARVEAQLAAVRGIRR
jgi:tetratricopeptide (TPR) repeat protein